MYKLIDAAVGSGDSVVLRSPEDKPTSLIIQIIDVSGWTGTIKVLGRLAGLGGNEPYHPIELIDLNTGGLIQGSTGATAAGTYRAIVDSMAVKVSHIHGAGTVSVYGDFTNA